MAQLHKYIYAYISILLEEITYFLYAHSIINHMIIKYILYAHSIINHMIIKYILSLLSQKVHLSTCVSNSSGNCNKIGDNGFPRDKFTLTDIYITVSSQESFP